ncbi:MAG: hypothetical protein ABSH52_20655 [Terriglobia bacterium]|jgi:WD40 repeat protein
MTYKAFVSYSHAADGKLAPAIQSALQSFAKPWYKLRAIRLFRDKTTLAMTPKLWPSIRAALDASEFFLLLASVESGRSEWVQREVEHWLRFRAPDKLLIIVTGSSPLAAEDASLDFHWIQENLLPPPLMHQLPEEPLYLDLRWLKSDEQLSARNPRFLEEIAGLSATLTGRPKDELIGTDVREHRRVRRLAWSAAILLALLTVASLMAALIAAWQRDRGRARELVSASILSEGSDPEFAVLSAATAVAATWPWGHSVLPAAEQRLHDAILASHLRMSLSGHNRPLTGVAWSPDGKRVATGSEDATAKVWDLQTGNKLLTLGGGESLAWAPDGKRLATGNRDATAKVWDAETGKLLFTLSGDERGARSMAWSPDAKRLATVSLDQRVAEVWDVAAGKKLLTLSGEIQGFLSVTWSPDGRRLATGDGDSNAKVWDAGTGKLLLTLSGHSQPVESVAWSPNGRHLATGSGDKTAKVWDADRGTELLTLSGHQSNIYGVAWSADGAWLATASGDHTAKVWDARTGKELLSLDHWRPVSLVTWSPLQTSNDQRLLTGSAASAHVWDAGTSELLTLSHRRDFFRSVAWSPDGKRLGTGSFDQTARVWDVTTGNQLLALRGHSPLAHETRTPWDSEAALEQLTLDARGFVFSVAWSSDGTRMATGSMDNTAKVWDAGTGKALLTVGGHHGPVSSVALSPNRKCVSTGNWDFTATVYDTETGKELVTMRGHNGPVVSVAWSPDGKRLATGSGDSTPMVWDAKSGRKLLTLKGHEGSVLSVAWSPDGKRLVTGSVDDTAKVWDAGSGKELLSLNGHRAAVSSVAWSPDGRRLATGSVDTTTRVWDAEAGKELLTLTGQTSRVLSVAWSPDGKRLAAVSGDHTVQVYAVEIHELMTLARERVTGHLLQESCKKYLQMDTCPPVPELPWW